MIIFLWLFATIFIMSYLSIHDYLGEYETLWTILFNLIFLGLAVYLVLNSYYYKEKKNIILFSILIVFIILSTILMIIS
ncbi:hypothetical protein CFK37_00090 [Virgibacillus phasianinus]|uniref:Uncharacterized protein n=1 Tax=Virgibacillus phasianinus TaxID=2017483 RepID=A0A220TY83_9BACI|nr:hypothetical protein CFK37_00090 [Virgibacillus phasianinus]